MRRLLCLLVVALPVASQRPGRAPRPAANIPENNPFTSDADIAAGRLLFLGRCGICHGQAGEGGRGPVLNTGRYRHGGSDRELFQIIRNGISNSEMRGANLRDHEVWRVVAYTKRLGLQGAVERAAGDPQAGRVSYERNACVQCHIINGQGGDLGPELSAIGASRSLRHLRQSVVDPGADIPLDYRPVSVTTQAGAKVRGIHLNEDDYSLQLRDTSGHPRSFLKSELKELKLEKESLMPAYGSLPAAEVDNLVAYLSSLRGK